MSNENKRNIGLINSIPMEAKTNKSTVYAQKRIQNPAALDHIALCDLQVFAGIQIDSTAHYFLAIVHIRSSYSPPYLFPYKYIILGALLSAINFAISLDSISTPKNDCAFIANKEDIFCEYPYSNTSASSKL